jgi:Domain of unknown function (DUF3846)
MARLLKVDGSIEPLDVPAAGLSLPDLQRLVDGFIEIVRLGEHENGGLTVLIVDEEGRLKSKPVNPLATEIYRAAAGFDVIVGDAVLCVIMQGGEDDERIV